MQVHSERIEFPGSQGAKLAARLDLPEGAPRAYALFAHCFTCTKDIFAASRIASGLAEDGFAVLRFDFTGLGASEGDFANTNFTSNVGDLIAAGNWLAREREPAKLLIGHSLGGAAVLTAASKIEGIKAVATIAAPSEPSHITRLFTEARPEIEAKGEAEVHLVGRPFRIRKQFLDDVSSHNMEQCIANLHKALIVFHSPQDQQVGVENAARIFATAKHPKSFISLDHADHILSRKEDALYVAKVLSSWSSRYIGADSAA